MADEELRREIEEARKQMRQAGEQPAAPAKQRPQQAAQPKQSQKPKAVPMSARRPGPVKRVADRVSQSISRIHPPTDARTIAIVLLILIVIALLAENWSPVRINLFGLYIDVPKAVAFVVNLALGMALLWLWQRHQARRRPREGSQQ